MLGASRSETRRHWLSPRTEAVVERKSTTPHPQDNARTYPASTEFLHGHRLVEPTEANSTALCLEFRGFPPAILQQSFFNIFILIGMPLFPFFAQIAFLQFTSQYLDSTLSVSALTTRSVYSPFKMVDFCMRQNFANYFITDILILKH